MSAIPLPDETKQAHFRLTTRSGEESYNYGIAEATLTGWWDKCAGRHALRQLPVGGTVTDDDGDTWTRES